MESAGATFRVREPSVFAYFRFAAAMVFVATIVAINFAALLNRFLPLSASLALTSVPAVIIPALLVRRECRRAAERRAIRVTVDDRRVEWNPGDGSQPLGIDRAETGQITLDPEGMLRFQSSNSAWTFDLPTKGLEDGAAVIDRVRLWGQVDELRQTPFQLTEHLGRFVGGLLFPLLAIVAVFRGNAIRALPLLVFCLAVLAWVSRGPWRYRLEHAAARRILLLAALAALAVVAAIIYSAAVWQGLKF